MFYLGRNNKLKDLERVIEEYQDRLFSFAFFRVGSFDVAQDIVQDVFFKFFNENSRLDRVASIKSYLYRAILNRCIDYRRTHRQMLCLDAIRELAVPQEEKQFYEEFISIEELLRELPDEQAEILRLHFTDNMPFVDIASLMELSVNTVKSRFRYGIEKLRNSPKLKDFNFDE